MHPPCLLHTGSVDVGIESCPQSLLLDRQFTRSLVVGSQTGRYIFWLFVSKLEAAKKKKMQQQQGAACSYLPSRDANSAMA